MSSRAVLNADSVRRHGGTCGREGRFRRRPGWVGKVFGQRTMLVDCEDDRDSQRIAYVLFNARKSTNGSPQRGPWCPIRYSSAVYFDGFFELADFYRYKPPKRRASYRQRIRFRSRATFRCHPRGLASAKRLAAVPWAMTTLLGAKASSASTDAAAHPHKAAAGCGRSRRCASPSPPLERQRCAQIKRVDARGRRAKGAPRADHPGRLRRKSFEGFVAWTRGSSRLPESARR